MTYYNDTTPNEDGGVITTDKFRVNPEAKKRIWVAENFYENIDEVRNYALQQWYFDDEGYEGLRTRKQFVFDGTIEKFESIMGKKITRFADYYGMCGRFQSNKADMRPVWHCDSQEYAAVIYLTPDAPVEAGTGFYQHKATKLRGGEPNVGEAFNGETWVDGTPYEQVDFVGNVYNRLVIWDAKLIHAAPIYFGWDINSSRLFHIFFFDSEDALEPGE